MSSPPKPLAEMSMVEIFDWLQPPVLTPLNRLELAVKAAERRKHELETKGYWHDPLYPLDPGIAFLKRRPL